MNDAGQVWRLGTICLLATLVLAAFATAAMASGSNLTELSNIESNYICISCHEPLELVSSPQAQSEKAYILSLIDKGESTAQIKSDMVDEYGTAVLAKPPASGFNLTVYILPPLLVVCGLGLLAFTLPKWRARAREAAATPMSAGAAALNPEDTSRLDDELDRLI